MDIAYNKTDGVVLPITNTRISASEYNQIAASLMHIINTAGLTPDVNDNGQLLNALGPRIVKTYSNGTSWYRVYSDGWCEQGGELNASSSTTITFLKPFADTTYYIAKNYIGSYTGTWLGEYVRFYDKTSTSIKTYVGGGTDAYVWEAKGYIA